jgi:hypothetical protein
VFTVDFNYQEPSLNLIKKYYQVEYVPALIISDGKNETLLQGRLFTENEIIMKMGIV